MNGNKKIILLFLTVIYSTVFSQDYRVMYNYSFVSDSTNVKFVENEMMVLDVAREGSVFYSHPKFRYDSIVIEKHKNRENILEADRSRILFFVEKEYPNFEMMYHTTLGKTNYAVADSAKINWHLENDQNTIRGFAVQKATANYGGRQWIAWYTKDIPIFDGPFKFNGLPGLILEVEDTKSEHKFEFLGIENRSNGYSNFYKVNKLKELKVNGNEFHKAWEAYKKDPAKDVKFRLLSSKFGLKINYDGKDYSVSDMIRNAEEIERAKIKNNNNFLELTLYR
ncbi:GLPGLI family protein [Chryseobacterium gotjawalense]|uniref:GLPGLI family protein n=1 Tax=Chryseobacterium gotjawalense TaxID=3042315 RepID=A0ABY8RDI2_9FLAO|nr:GLPGLI family protein [Chryseobacterium sp. wdc7]WHF51282.1 GLPGLI family protein [Chryseobacterium sp. wdc7]